MPNSTRRLLTLSLGLLLGAHAVYAVYSRPTNKAEDARLHIFYETSRLTELPVFDQVRAAAVEFESLQENSPALRLASNPEVLSVAAEQIVASLAPLAGTEHADIQARLATTLSTRQGSGFGYGGMAFPEVHIWTKQALKEIFQRGDHPPGLTLDPQSQMLNQEFVAPNGSLNPITIVVDESLSPDERSTATAEFLRYWTETVRRTQDSIAAVLIYSAVRDVTLTYLNERTNLPAWFKLGTANLVAYNDCAKLLGDGAAEHALNLCVGPHSLPNPADAITAKLDPNRVSNAEKPAERASFELCRTAQNSTSRSFIRLVLAAVAKAKDKSQSDDEIVEIYRSIAGSNKQLFGA